MNGREQIRLALATIGHPIRLDVLEAAVAGPIKAKDLAHRLNVEIGVVAYHVRTMAKDGLIEETSNHKVRGATQRIYRASEAGRLILDSLELDDEPGPGQWVDRWNALPVERKLELCRSVAWPSRAEADPYGALRPRSDVPAGQRKAPVTE